MPTEADAMWDAAIRIAQALAEQRAIRRTADREERNARRRARPRRVAPPKPAPSPERDDYPDADGCSCSTSPMPPCGWCENGGGADDPEEI